MERLRELLYVLNVIRNEHELKSDITKDEFNVSDINGDFDRIQQMNNSLDQVKLALDDTKFLTLIKVFLDNSDVDRLSTEEDVTNLRNKCDALRLEFDCLTKKLNYNEDQISKLESENMKLKTALCLSESNESIHDHSDKKLNVVSPSYIHSSFKFDINPEKNKKSLDNGGAIMISPKLKTLYDLVMLYSIKGNYAVAIPLCEQALVDIEKSSSKYSNDYASMLHVLANVYRDIGDYQKSAYLMLEVLLIRENLPDKSKTKVLETLNCISVLYGLMYCWQQAAAYSRRSLDIMREIYFGADDINIAMQLETMALIYKNDNQSRKAIECLEEALDIFTAHRHFHHSDIARVQSLIASCYMLQFQFDISLNLYKDILMNCYQSHLYSIWGLDKSLWQMAEDQQSGLTSTADERKHCNIYSRSLDNLNEAGLRDILANMASIYRQLNMNKAATYLETWPDRNIPAATVPKRIARTRSFVHLNEETDINNVFKGKSCVNMSCGGLYYISPIGKGFKMNSQTNSIDGLSKRSSSISTFRKSKDFDVTIFDSWSQFVPIKRSD